MVTSRDEARSGLESVADQVQQKLSEARLARGRILSAILVLWIVVTLIIDLLHFLPEGTTYYLGFDLAILPVLLAYFVVSVFILRGSSQQRPMAKRTRAVSLLGTGFSLAFTLWAAALAVYQTTPYTLFIVAFMIAAVMLLSPLQSIVVYSIALVGHLITHFLVSGVLVGGATLFLEVAAMLVVATLVSILLYRQKTNALRAEQALLQKTESQEAEIARRTAALNERLQERDILLREIHHRVKNNLQILASLVGLSQSHHNTSDPNALVAGIEQRISTMAIVHQQLYDSAQLDRLDVSEYFESLIGYVVGSYSLGPGVELSSQIEPISVGVDTALNLGLILTEALSNAFRHAWSRGTAGTDRRVHVTLSQQEGILKLTVQDNGHGAVPGETRQPAEPQGLGLLLIAQLSSQLGGSYSIVQDRGTTLNCVIPRSTVGRS